MKHRNWVAAVTAAAVLCGCGGDGGGGDASRVEGVLAGVATRSSTERQVIAYASEGRFMAVENGGFFFDAEYAIADGMLSGTARVYGTSLGPAHVRSFTETASVSGAADEDGRQVTIGTTTFDLAHHGDDRDDSSLAVVQGTWVYDAAGSNTSTLTIAGDGATSSTNDSGCASAGSIAIIDADFNLYDSATTVSDATGVCPNPVEGSYTGLIAVLADSLVVMLAKSDYMFFYPYTAQP